MISAKTWAEFTYISFILDRKKKKIKAMTCENVFENLVLVACVHPELCQILSCRRMYAHPLSMTIFFFAD